MTDSWLREIDVAHAVINLAGKNVNCRYTRGTGGDRPLTRDAVRAITRRSTAAHSRLRSSRLQPPRSTAIAVMRSATRLHRVGEGIPVQTATKWKHAFDSVPTPRTRRVLLRMPFVLGRDGGVLKMLATMSRCSSAAPSAMGGKSSVGFTSTTWCESSCAIDDEQMTGLYIAASPNAVTNAEFMRELRHAVHRPWSPPVPAVMVRLGCFLLRTEPVLALTGRRAIPRRLSEDGIAFEHPRLPAALKSLLN